ncbi:hypothetical protein [Ferruginibacter profundus]
MKNCCFVLLVISIFCSCKKNDNLQGGSSNITCDPAISYSAKVKPVFVSNCTASGCHDGVNSASLAEYTTARDAAQQIRSAVSRGLMPMYSTLSAADKAAILCWIDSGTKNN